MLVSHVECAPRALLRLLRLEKRWDTLVRLSVCLSAINPGNYNSLVVTQTFPWLHFEKYRKHRLLK